ncbi:ABC transporter permease [Rhodanobacter sp. DHG33]|uniref:ABC transporter permease n=1 Tax=Rhodanobacter sp. DHG33 TaxID=2775921 RepID=UPI0017827BB6|nr:ABC transporter permease [Rhodanobacter sp. DHG33]MBD8899331.1 ABC transporter permease [Rhodanobacter sp. DHG33]
MLRYSFELAALGLRRFPKSTVLVVLTAALGLAACMTTLTLLHVLSADPLPGRSQNLYLAWVDTVLAKPSNAGADIMAMNGFKTNNYHTIKLADAQALLAAHRAAQQSVVVDVVADEVSDDGRHAQNQQMVLATTSDFIPMFGVALRYGRDWTPAEDAARAPVAVIDTDLAQKLFGTPNAVGKSVRLKKTLFRVVGVIQPYVLQPHFYALSGGDYSSDGGENLYVPYAAALDAGLAPYTTDGCDDARHGKFGDAPDPAHCAVLGLWVQLDTPQQVAAYRTYLQNYVEQQKDLGSFGKPPRSELTGVAEWMKQNNVVPDSVRLNVWLAASFLLLCMVNVAGLLAARFLRRSGDVGVRRALGAPRRAVFLQHVLESGLACLVGGVLALPLTWLGLWILRQQSSDFAGLAHLDPAMFGSLFALALAVGVLVGLLPAWRMSRVEPGLQVKGE